MEAVGKVHHLGYSYKEYRENKNSIANCHIDRYIVSDELGRGSYGAVYKGMNEISKKVVAIKVLDLESVERQPHPKLKQIRRRLCRTESELMLRCDNQHLIKCYDVYQNESLKILVMEFCGNGTLDQEIKSSKRIAEKEAILILKQIIRGIAELHRQNIVHRDLKAENILIHNGVYKIADFGFSKLLQIQLGQELNRTTLGTVITMAPEVMRQQPYGLKADIWSIGCILFQMITGRNLYASKQDGFNTFERLERGEPVIENKLLAFKIVLSDQLKQFLKQLFVVDTKKRIGWEALVAHPIFYNPKDSKLNNQFRLDYEIKVPAQQLKFQEILQSNIADREVAEVKVQTAGELRLTYMPRNQIEEKKKLVVDEDTLLFMWAKDSHLECLKTELILDEIITQIERLGLLEMDDRNTIEFMYLLATRCLNNMSIIQEKMKDHAANNIIKNLSKTVENLYQRVIRYWKQQSEKLTGVENEVKSIVVDRFLKIFKKDTIKQKDLFLGGIENIEYSKVEQIQFTSAIYIDDILKKVAPIGKEAKKALSYLAHYREICLIERSQLNETVTFEQKVELILN